MNCGFYLVADNYVNMRDTQHPTDVELQTLKSKCVTTQAPLKTRN